MRGFAGTLSFRIGSLPTLSLTGSGSVDVSGSRASPVVGLAAGLFAGHIATLVPSSLGLAPLDELTANLANQAGIFARESAAGPIRGALPLSGSAKLCLFFACDASPLANVTVPLSVIGAGGTATGQGPVNLTVYGAPWTTGVVKVSDGETFGMTRGGNGQTREGALGSLSLVSPIFISTSLPQFKPFNAVARLALTLDPILDYCRNGLDDDGDGLTDYPEDLGCDSPDDTSEHSDLLVCDNGRDDDGDGLTDFPADPGCSDPTDPSERSGPACNNGFDDDGDGVADYPLDPGCDSPDDASERGTPICDNGIDDDGDGRTDYPADSGCVGPADGTERGVGLICDDGLDQDGDGLADFPADPGCIDAYDISEGPFLAACANGIDDDDDGAVDLADGGCTSLDDDSEDVVVGPGLQELVLDGATSLPTESVHVVGLGLLRIRAGGEVGFRVSAVGGGYVSLEGGSIGGELRMLGGSATITQGSVGGLIRGGSVDVYGGTLGAAIEAGDHSEIRLHASDTGGRPFGPVPEVVGDLSGTLEDGTPFAVSFLREPGATIELAPEPGEIAAGVVALAALAVRRSSARSRA